MSACVIQRYGHTIAQGVEVKYDDRPSSYERADAIAGRKLDRRKNYAIIDGQVCESAEGSQACSGCYSGAGCHECGYTGRIRQAHWVPLATTAGVSKRG